MMVDGAYFSVGTVREVRARKRIESGSLQLGRGVAATGLRRAVHTTGALEGAVLPWRCCGLGESLDLYVGVEERGVVVLLVNANMEESLGEPRRTTARHAKRRIDV